MDYLNNARICKHINACFIYFALKHELQNLPRTAFEFHDNILGTLKKYQEKVCGEQSINTNRSGRPVSVFSPSRKFGRKKVDHRLTSFVSSSLYDKEELERITGVAKDTNGSIYYQVVWIDDPNQKWVPVEEMMSARLMVKQFLAEFDEFLESFESGKLSKRIVYSITRVRGVFKVEFMDKDEQVIVSEENVVPCRFFLNQFAI